MRSIVNLGQMLKIEMGINLRRGDMRMSQHFLHGTQITAGLQQMGSKGVPQDMRMHILVYTLLPGSALESMTYGTGTDRITTLR